MLHSRLIPSSLLVIGFCALGVSLAQQPKPFDVAAERAAQHNTEEWLTVAPHLPDPATATPAALEMAGDVLRARRLQEDAVDYFRYAMQRGGDEVTLLNRIGVTELEMNQAALARACFKRSVLLRRKYAEGWNNLGATENMDGNLQTAIIDYQRAVKLNRKNAVFHANLGTAYFETKDYESSRREFDMAIKLDEGVFRRGGFGGSQVHVLTGDDRGRFAFEMARLAAASHEDESMLHWLSVSAESGFDVREGMRGVKEFEPYRKDARITLMLRNVRAMQAKQIAASDPVPALPEHTTKEN
jgi:tetratricopeptide (TPR) repeat protein